MQVRFLPFPLSLPLPSICFPVSTHCSGGGWVEVAMYQCYLPCECLPLRHLKCPGELLMDVSAFVCLLFPQHTAEGVGRWPGCV